MEEENREMAPTLQEWKVLYEEALHFKQIAPWNWMWDTDIFGVQNPSDGEISYCCILGRNGEFFGLAVYLGTEGLECYLKTSEGRIDAEGNDILHLKRCLLVSFGDRSYLQKPDLEIIRNLGLKFRGRFSWPLFRSYRPGYFPWYLTKAEVVFLTLCLEQTREVALRFKEDCRLLESPDGKSYLIRIRDENLKWQDSWYEPKPLTKIVMMAKTIDLARINNIVRSSKRLRQVWEVDFFYAPAYIAEKGKRPYFPIVFLFVDNYSFFILNTYISSPEKYRIEFHEQLLKTFENTKIIPEEIWVRKEELRVYLEPIAEKLGFKVQIVKKLKAIDEARKGMIEYFGRRR
ncbi:MAG: hypothetical protein NC820_06585 [Candidatus Omnitrophica bacterium]|nr:hypothetical protein [Candidatus Omnitrophota bacterium]